MRRSNQINTITPHDSAAIKKQPPTPQTKTQTTHTQPKSEKKKHFYA